MTVSISYMHDEKKASQSTLLRYLVTSETKGTKTITSARIATSGVNFHQKNQTIVILV